MKYVIEFDTSKPCFDKRHPEWMVARLLLDIANTIVDNGLEELTVLKDKDGNEVGHIFFMNDS